MKKINSWYIEEGHTATFGNDDFESWWLAGMDRDDKIKKHHRIELYENCLYLAEAEQREMTQSASELKSAINDWADEWNKKINVSAAAATLGSIKSPRKAASSRENGKKGGRPATENIDRSKNARIVEARSNDVNAWSNYYYFLSQYESNPTKTNERKLRSAEKNAHRCKRELLSIADELGIGYGTRGYAEK